MQQSTFSPQGTTVGLQIGENAETEENIPGFLRWKISESDLRIISQGEKVLKMKDSTLRIFENERIPTLRWQIRAPWPPML